MCMAKRTNTDGAVPPPSPWGDFCRAAQPWVQARSFSILSDGAPSMISL
jgi:hypothetical protein